MQVIPIIPPGVAESKNIQIYHVIIHQRLSVNETYQGYYGKKDMTIRQCIQIFSANVCILEQKEMYIYLIRNTAGDSLMIMQRKN